MLFCIDSYYGVGNLIFGTSQEGRIFWKFLIDVFVQKHLRQFQVLPLDVPHCSQSLVRPWQAYFYGGGLSYERESLASGTYFFCTEMSQRRRKISSIRGTQGFPF